MNKHLLLENVRQALMRTEETIIFDLIERARFRLNDKVYARGAFGPAVGDDSIVGYLLRETECLHARLRRYTSPDEHPFYAGLPVPILPTLRFDENPLRPNTVNLNADIRELYEREIVPLICLPGDDQQYGSSAVADVTCLQSLSHRVHYGKFVAESKYRASPAQYQALIDARDADGLLSRVTDRAVESAVLHRVGAKARVYGRPPAGDDSPPPIDPAQVVCIFERWVIPLSKKVQVEYLLQRTP
jgi:chorismate mutase